MDKPPGVESTRVAALVTEIKYYAQVFPDVVAEGQKKELIRAAKNLIANLQDPIETAWYIASGVSSLLQTFSLDCRGIALQSLTSSRLKWRRVCSQLIAWGCTKPGTMLQIVL